MEGGPDRWRLYRLALREAARAIKAAGARLWLRFSAAASPSPGRLIIAPQDLRTSDPTVANDIYSGHFVFAGRAVATRGRSPFACDPPSQAWGEALYGFGWLRDLRAADTALARANARALVTDFIAGGGDRRLARDTAVLARRLISFLSQSPLILEGADHAFYARFVRVIGRAVRDLEADLKGGALPYQRLQATIALGFAGLCCDGYAGLLRRSTRALTRELDRQILADGGHLSRNPRLLMDLLLDLLPLRQAYASRGIEAPEALVRAIDRMLPHLRLLRLGDGTLARFNGMGVTPAGHLATLLMYEGAPGQAMRRAPHSGYERLTAGTAILVADVGSIPPLLHSAEAHAGCLSFEFCSGPHSIIVNCGAPLRSMPASQPARMTAAHSTAAIADASSCRFLEVQGRAPERWIRAWLLRRIGPVILEGPAGVTVERGENSGTLTLRARHDAYAPAFRSSHERRWGLAAAGERLEGEDVFARTEGDESALTAAVRFHLAPGIRTSRAEPAGPITLTLPNREVWQFRAEGEMGLEESVYFAATEGARRIEQIVLRVPVSGTTRIGWHFERLVGAPGR